MALSGAPREGIVPEGAQYFRFRCRERESRGLGGGCRSLMRTALCQPVNRLTPKRRLTGRRLTPAWLGLIANLERCFSVQGATSFVAIYYLPFGALKAAKMHACRSCCRNEVGLLQHAVAVDTAGGNPGSSRSPNPRLLGERASSARLSRPAKRPSWITIVRSHRRHPSL